MGGDDEVSLARRCADGDADALRELEARYLSLVPAALAHMKLPKATVEDVAQTVRDRLLVAEDGAEPRIVGYAGQGSLRGLVKVMAVRAAISRIRKERREVPGDDFGELASPQRDPEMAFLEDHYRAAFKETFEAAVRDLDAHDRNLLRMHLLGELTLEQLATLYGVHRATVVRSLARVRKRLFTETRRGLQKKLRISPSELDSVMGLIQSRLDASVSRVLRTLDSSERSVAD